jgi:uncharacterized DUF497 family protein
VAHTVNVAEGEDVIRIISARKADKKERTYYDVDADRKLTH